MGPLNLPTSGTVYLDTQIFIYSVELRDTYWKVLDPIWATIRDNHLTAITSELTLMEVLVGPLRRNDDSLQRAYESIFNSSEVSLVPITQSILRDAAGLRASIPSLRTPDAIHAATARLYKDCKLLITNDPHFRHVPLLPHFILGDLSSE